MRFLPAAPLLATALAVPAAAQTPQGMWRTPPNEVGAHADVRIAPCAGGEGTLCGVIVRVYDAPPDVPDVTGRVILRDMAQQEAGRWGGGTVWAPDDDRTYRGRMSLTEEGLRLEGCVLGGIICRGQTWTRLD